MSITALAAGAPGKVQGLGDANLGALELDGKQLDAQLAGSLTGASLERTIDGASTLTLTISDPQRFLMAGGYYQRRADLRFDGLWFRLSTLNKAGDSFDLGFIDREVALLQRHTRPRKASRANKTRAEFLKMLVGEEPHIGFECPELHTKQPIKSLNQADTKSLSDSRRARRIADGGLNGITGLKLKVKGQTATRSQIKLMNRVLNVAESLGAGERATLGMVCANIGEASYSNSARNASSDAFGLFQLIPATARSTGLDPQNVEACANWFLTKGFYKYGGAIKVAKDNPHDTPGDIASKVEGSDQGGGFYNAYLAEAKAIVAAYGGVADSPNSDNTQYYVQQYQFSRGQPGGPRHEDTWACGRRLADEVAWRWFIVAGVVYFISDFDLIRSRPRMALNESTPGIDSIDFQLDANKRVPDELTITCRAPRWAAPPGSVIAMDETMGPCTGAWIVTDIVRDDLFDQATQITATRPVSPEPEPRPSVASRSGASTQDGGLDAGGLSSGNDPAGDPTSPVGAMWAKAVAIDKQHLPYVWGGGHVKIGQPNGAAGAGPNPPSGYDCSGLVSALLHAGGLLHAAKGAVYFAPPDTPLDTLQLEQWGVPGEGHSFTVWVSTEHTFAQFKNVGGHKSIFIEAHHTGTIVGFEDTRTTTGFVARCWPGL